MMEWVPGYEGLLKWDTDMSDMVEDDMLKDADMSDRAEMLSMTKRIIKVVPTIYELMRRENEFNV